MIFTISTLSNTVLNNQLIFLFNFLQKLQKLWTEMDMANVVRVLCNYSVCSMSSEVPNVDYDKPFLHNTFYI